MKNDEAADFFEFSDGRDGPDVVAEVDRATFEALLAARQAQAAADRALVEAVAKARANHATWATIGAALGISRQAAHARFSKVA